MSQTAKNIIYTGVAGTGKTYQLLQLAKHYTDYLPTVDAKTLLEQWLEPMSWREVVCLIFLDGYRQQQDLLKVPEIVNHEFFIAKAAQKDRDKHLKNIVWSVLGAHSAADSQTVTYKNRAAQAYFDKDASGAWYLLPESHELLAALLAQLTEFWQDQQQNSHQAHQQNQRFSMVSFHQAYGYEEFIEGIRPSISANQPSQNSQMHYEIQDGAFLQLCQRAIRHPEQRYAMLIDEINRANVSRVFGELLSLIEPDKRAGQANAMMVHLAYSHRAFSVPNNVDIYATMNTQDYSLTALDMALRRRFHFIDCPPRPELLPIINNNKPQEKRKNIKNAPTSAIDLAQLLTGLNQRIVQTLGQEAQLGHAFLWSVEQLSQLQTVFIEQIIPQLAQAAGGQLAVLQYIFADEQQPITQQFICEPQAHHRKNGQSLAVGSQNAFFGQTLPTGGFVVNPDLINKTAAFADAAIYQRLYE